MAGPMGDQGTKAGQRVREQVLYSMLERERWVRLPLVPGGLPNLVEALEGAREAPASRLDTNSFGEWVAHGNPWRRQDPGGYLRKPRCGPRMDPPSLSFP